MYRQHPGYKMSWQRALSRIWTQGTSARQLEEPLCRKRHHVPGDTREESEERETFCSWAGRIDRTNATDSPWAPSHGMHFCQTLIR